MSAKLTTPLKFFFFYSVLSLILEALNSIIILNMNDASNLIVSTIALFHIFTLAEFLLISIVLLLWQPNGFIRKITILLMVAFAITWTYVEITSDTMTFDSLVVSIEAVILVGLAATSMLTLAMENSGALIGNPRFWVSSGVLLYFAGNLIVFALGSQLLQQEEAARNAWRIHAFLNLISYLFYTTGYLCLGRFRK